MPGIASSAPAVLIAHLASVTTTHPGRLRRRDAPEPPAARHRRAVRDARGAPSGPDRPRDRPRPGHRPGHRLRASALARSGGRRPPDPARGAARVLLRDDPADHAPCPAPGNMPAIWLLGSSDFSARLAGELGLPFSFAHHFMPQNTVPALEIYRRNFTPSATLDEPYAKVGVAVVCAETDEQARWLHGPARLSFLRLRTAGRRRSPPRRRRPPTSTRPTSRRSSTAGRHRTSSARRRPSASGLLELQERTGADELIQTTCHDHADRLPVLRARRGSTREPRLTIRHRCSVRRLAR